MQSSRMTSFRPVPSFPHLLAALHALEVVLNTMIKIMIEKTSFQR